MKITKEMVQPFLVSVDSQPSDFVYLRISKVDTATIFRDEDELPRNTKSDEDWTFIAGDLQIRFKKGTETVEEALLYPLYKINEDWFEEGDYINVFKSVSQDVIDYCKARVIADRTAKSLPTVLGEQCRKPKCLFHID